MALRSKRSFTSAGPDNVPAPDTPAAAIALLAAAPETLAEVPEVPESLEADPEFPESAPRAEDSGAPSQPPSLRPARVASSDALAALSSASVTSS